MRFAWIMMAIGTLVAGPQDAPVQPPDGFTALYNGREAPVDLTPETDPVEVDLRCARALGAAWGRARQTWQDQTPPDVREARDHLALAARKRWSFPRG